MRRLLLCIVMAMSFQGLSGMKKQDPFRGPLFKRTTKEISVKSLSEDQEKIYKSCEEFCENSSAWKVCDDFGRDCIYVDSIARMGVFAEEVCWYLAHYKYEVYPYMDLCGLWGMREKKIALLYFNQEGDSWLRVFALTMPVVLDKIHRNINILRQYYTFAPTPKAGKKELKHFYRVVLKAVVEDFNKEVERVLQEHITYVPVEEGGSYKEETQDSSHWVLAWFRETWDSWIKEPEKKPYKLECPEFISFIDHDKIVYR